MPRPISLNPRRTYIALLNRMADDYVTKPFDTEEVLARIRTALRHRLSAAAETPR